ncbi:hypothetical protein AGLY_015551 [Aphis glycines]|uniref:C2H2-type domain-containing protein n=1 Tax=Aphis glycines TaxID=307491 RepID=A0A6G0T095_APHGL|nr:hypothetical protein AGLY_015551 [Aphis glycines]
MFFRKTSSANRRIFEYLMEKTISLKNKLNNNGKRGSHCGIQDITEIESEIRLLHKTLMSKNDKIVNLNQCTYYSTWSIKQMDDDGDIRGRINSIKMNELTCIDKTRECEGPYHCNINEKTFSQIINLKAHCKTHKREKLYPCDTCGKSFTQNYNLIIHQQLHTGEKPYSCDLCGRMFAYRCNLTVHRRIHTKEKLFSCDVYKKRFSQNSNLKTRQKIHTREKPYLCEE